LLAAISLPVVVLSQEPRPTTQCKIASSAGEGIKTFYDPSKPVSLAEFFKRACDAGYSSSVQRNDDILSIRLQKTDDSPVRTGFFHWKVRETYDLLYVRDEQGAYSLKSTSGQVEEKPPVGEWKKIGDKTTLPAQVWTQHLRPNDR